MMNEFHGARNDQKTPLSRLHHRYFFQGLGQKLAQRGQENWQAEHQQLGEYFTGEKSPISGVTVLSWKKGHNTNSSFVSGSNLVKMHQRRKRKDVDVQITPVVPSLPSNNDLGIKLGNIKI